MPNFDTSNLVSAQTRLINRFATEALKSINPVTYLAIRGVSEINAPSYKVERERDDRPVNVYTFDRTERTVLTARDHNHSGTSGDTIESTLSFNTLAVPFSLTLKQADNNLYDYEELFNSEVENVIKDFMTKLEDDAKDFLFASRSNFNGADYPVGTFDATDFVYTIPESDIAPSSPTGATAAQILDSILEENFLSGNKLIFCDSLAYDKFRKISEQGAGNDTNMSFQFGDKTFIRSIKLNDSTRFGSLVGTYNKGVFCAVPENTIAHLDWIPKQNRDGVDDGALQTYSMIVNPIDGLEYAFHYYPERINGTARNGYTQDRADEFELSIDSSFELAPLSSASQAQNETVVQAFAFV